MFVVVAYDISDDERRLKVSQLLANFGDRVQKSVFECDISEAQFARLQGGVVSLIRPEADTVRYYRVCESCRAKMQAIPPPAGGSDQLIV